MENDATFQYIKLLLEYLPVWFILLVGVIVWLRCNPKALEAIPRYVSSAKFGDIEFELREVKQQLAETESHVRELEEESLRLDQLYASFDPHASVSELEETRQTLKALAGRMNDLAPVRDGLKKGADPKDVYAAAEILRQRRDINMFDPLIEAVERIASTPDLEGLRYHTVWSLASAVHKTVLAAVKHSRLPLLTEAQLQAAKRAMEKLRDNPHVRKDRPDKPERGIRGPAGYALNWIQKGLDKFKVTGD